MKLKLSLLALVAACGIYSAVACGYSECGGGNVRCCTVGNQTYWAHGHE